MSHPGKKSKFSNGAPQARGNSKKEVEILISNLQKSQASPCNATVHW